MFGVHAFPNEGLMDHSLHTVLIDREGKLVANIEGNRFTATSAWGRDRRGTRAQIANALS